ncbi:MAG TPA: ATP-binding protein, partial [Holophagaceae bacterium]
MPLSGPAAASPADPGLLAGRVGLRDRILGILAVALVYYAAALFPRSPSLAYEAYLFWPAAAVGYTALFILGPEAALGLVLGSLVLNLTGRLPWSIALAMTALQVLGPVLAWRGMVALRCPHPNLRRLPDLLRWMGTATLASTLCSAAAGTFLLHRTLPGGFHDPWITAFSWFLGDQAPLFCLGPALLLFLVPGPALPRPTRRLARLGLEVGLLLVVTAALLLGGQIRGDLSPDFRLALRFALVLPVLWMALRFGPRGTAIGMSLLSMAFLASLETPGRLLPEEAIRFSQLYLLVLAFAAQVTAVSYEEARQARHELGLKDLQTQRMEAVGTLAGGLVHEFNNQLTVLLGNLDRLRDQTAPTPECLATLTRIETSALALEDTVGHLRNLSHQAPIRTVQRPLEDALAPFLASLSGLPERIAFQASVPPGLQVVLDPELLRQALQILLTNSLEATDGPGHIRLRAEALDADWLSLTLEDDGHGMAPDVLQRACDPYFSTKPVGSGRGLGLSIAFALTRQMGGELTLDSHSGQGTRAELRLPLSQAPLPAPVAPVSART